MYKISDETLQLWDRTAALHRIDVALLGHDLRWIATVGDLRNLRDGIRLYGRPHDKRVRIYWSVLSAELLSASDEMVVEIPQVIVAVTAYDHWHAMDAARTTEWYHGSHVSPIFKANSVTAVPTQRTMEAEIEIAVCLAVEEYYAALRQEIFTQKQRIESQSVEIKALDARVAAQEYKYALTLRILAVILIGFVSFYYYFT